MYVLGFERRPRASGSIAKAKSGASSGSHCLRLETGRSRDIPETEEHSHNHDLFFPFSFACLVVHKVRCSSPVSEAVRPRRKFHPSRVLCGDCFELGHCSVVASGMRGF
jgi:hypothetical protein